MKLKLILTLIGIVLVMVGVWYYTDEIIVFQSVLLGALIPLVINLSTFYVTRKIVGHDPVRLLKANMTGFLIRLVLYAGIIVTVSITVELRKAPFIITFFLIFIFLILLEALYFWRLFFRVNERGS